ncbi:hypothetical protein [Streptomyces niveus]|uniref:hypothetical protein n=1 Tax=Streptomyces niveus TaxID=193462 RepID=UPI00341C1DF9
MPADHEPVRGPLYVEATPLMVTLDVTSLVENNVHDLLDMLSEDDLFDEFLAATNADPDEHRDGALPDRLLFEELKTRLVDRLATKVALTGMQAVQAGEEMRRLGMERAVPAARSDRRAS